MTPSERVKKLEAEFETLAALCEGTARTQRLAIGAGVDPRKVGIGPDLFEEFSKRIHHFIADLGPMPDAVTFGDDTDERCPECGEILTGA